MKGNNWIDNQKYDPEDMLEIAELSCEMVDNGLWNTPLTTQDSGVL